MNTVQKTILNESFKDLFKGGDFLTSALAQMEKGLPLMQATLKLLDKNAAEIAEFGNEKATKMFKEYHEHLSDAINAGEEKNIKAYFAAYGKLAALQQQMGILNG
jgi:hypothetical protein